MPQSITYRDLYQAIDQLRIENNAGQREISNKLDAFIKEEYVPLRDRVNQLWIWGTIAVGVASLIANFAVGMVSRVLAGK
jgi:hypothetical protein